MESITEGTASSLCSVQLESNSSAINTSATSHSYIVLIIINGVRVDPILFRFQFSGAFTDSGLVMILIEILGS